MFSVEGKQGHCHAEQVVLPPFLHHRQIHFVRLIRADDWKLSLYVRSHKLLLEQGTEHFEWGLGHAKEVDNIVGYPSGELASS